MTLQRILQLHRGDQLTIIPILGDAEAEAPGRIIRFEVPTNRNAYDADLRIFHQKLGRSLEEMRTNAVVSPGAKTDILGSIALAEQEFRLSEGDAKHTMIILSDFIQEDRDINFRYDSRLATPITAGEFALMEARTLQIRLDGAHVYLGLLQSSEYTNLYRKRRSALEEFWIKYLKSSGASCEFEVDGLSVMKHLSAAP